MKIHGHKLKIREINQELKIGERNLGSKRFGQLSRLKIMHQNIIEIIKQKRPKEKRRNRRK